MLRLRGMVAEASGGREWAQGALESLAKASPTALKVRLLECNLNFGMESNFAWSYLAMEQRVEAHRVLKSTLCVRPENVAWTGA